MGKGVGKVQGIKRMGKDLRIGIVASRYNEFITDPLLERTVSVLIENGVGKDRIETVRVPGAYEIPLIAKKMAISKRFDSIVCLGAVIRGETPHFDYISAEVSRGIGQVALETGIPVIHGVLTTNTIDQAIERSSNRPKNKGEEAALTAIEIAQLVKRLES